MERMNSDVNNLLQKYLNGTITESEGEELFAWLKEHAPEEEDGIETILKAQYDSSFTETQQISSDASRRIMAKLMQSVEAMESEKIQAPVLPLRHRWTRYAAAAAVV